MSTEERLERLERLHRRMKQAGAVVVVLAAALLLMGQAVPKKSVEANEFILKNTEGKVLARLDLKDGGPRLLLLDQNGEGRAMLSVIGGKPALDMFDASGKARADLVVEADGPRILLFNGNEKGVPAMAATSNWLALYNTNETGARVTGSGLEMFGKNGVKTTLNERTPASAGTQSEPAKETAMNQMRQIVEAIKKCPEEIDEQGEYWVDYDGPPYNVEWDILPSKGVRSPFQGWVEFTLSRRSQETEKKRSGKLHEEYMDHATQLRIAFPFRNPTFRYEFALGSDSPELVKMLRFSQNPLNADTAKPVSVAPDRTCWQNAARSGGR